MDRMHLSARGQRVLSVCLALMLGMIGATQAAVSAPLMAPQSQEQITRLRIARCNDKGYVEDGGVSCWVVPYESSGVPITNMPAERFEVSDGGTPINGVTVEETRTLSAPTWVMMVVDMRANLGGKYINTVQTFIPQGLTKDAARAESKEWIGLLAVTGKLSTASGPTNLQRDEARESDFAEDVNASVNNKIRALPAQPSIPLHEAINKALLVTRQQDYGARAIVLVTAGFGPQSSAANIEELKRRAAEFSIPIYVLGLPPLLAAAPEEERLKSLATATFGEYRLAGDADAFTKAYRAIQDSLKTQYGLTFKVPNPSKSERKLTFKVSLPDGKIAAAEYTLKPQAPDVPQIEGLKFMDGNKAVAPDKFPSTDVVVIPEIYARNVSQVTYQLDGGEVVLKELQPFAFTIKGGALSPGEHTLLVKVYGDKGTPGLITEATGKFTVIGGPVATAPASAPTLAAPTAEPPNGIIGTLTHTVEDMAQDPIMLALLVIGLLAILVLIVWIIYSLIRKRSSANLGPVTDVITNAFPTGVGYTTTGTGYQASPFGAAGGRLNDEPTQVFADELGESPQTQVLQASKAMLEVLNGESKGDLIPLGAPGKNVVLIGRDADALAGDVRLKSKFVSRRHAEIHIEGDDMYLVDCGSDSGTKLNGQKLEKGARNKLEVGMEISFADINARVDKVD